ncbi:hypothetical protein ABIF44_002495 [Bradyrhizobium japonicum]|nr:hypothetical protein [Bradyrhizobium japonicum]MDH6171531.1 hypothetical protein [Bradyrhizobium japonicum]
MIPHPRTSAEGVFHLKPGAGEVGAPPWQGLCLTWKRQRPAL